MKLEHALKLYDNADTLMKDKIIIADEPVFSKENAVTHTMPVGEQMHWIKHLAADWIKKICDRNEQ